MVLDVTQLSELVLSSNGFVCALRAEGGGHACGRCQSERACCGGCEPYFATRCCGEAAMGEGARAVARVLVLLEGGYASCEARRHAALSAVLLAAGRGGHGCRGGGALRWAVPGRGEREGVHAGFGALCVALRKKGWRALERSQPLLILDALQCASNPFVPVLRKRAPPREVNPARGGASGRTTWLWD